MTFLVKIINKTEKSSSPILAQKELQYYKGLYGLYGLPLNGPPDATAATANNSMASICSKSETRQQDNNGGGKTWVHELRSV